MMSANAGFLTLMVLSLGIPVAVAGTLQFCPPNSEDEARSALGIGSRSNISLAKLKEVLKSKGIGFERKSNRKAAINCGVSNDLDRVELYFVYGDYVEAERYKRTYILVSDDKGVVRYIQEHHQFLPPTFTD